MYLVLIFLLPLLLLCLYLEKRARRIIISFCCGVVACLGAYHLNNAILSLFHLPETVLAVAIAPAVEELLKFTPILVVALIVNKGRRGSTANAYSVGIGFCLVENVYFLLKYLDSANLVWIIFRSIGTGLMHGMSATIIGLGIYFSRKKPKLRWLYLACTLFIAIAYHTLFNFLVQGGVIMRILAILMPMVTYVFILLFVKQDEIKRFLSDEVEGA